MLLQKAANEKLHLHQMDVKGAYLNAPIDQEIYVQQPPGYEQTGENGSMLMCNLKKSLYGLKQSGRNWYNTLTNFLKNKGFVSSKIDPCIYKRTVANEKIIFWVDDIIICSEKVELISETKKLLHEEFNMDDRGPLQWFLGIDFKRSDGGSYTMSQERYSEAILKRFGMTECNQLRKICSYLRRKQTRNRKIFRLDKQLEALSIYLQQQGQIKVGLFQRCHNTLTNHLNHILLQ